MSAWSQLISWSLHPKRPNAHPCCLVEQIHEVEDSISPQGKLLSITLSVCISPMHSFIPRWNFPIHLILCPYMLLSTIVRSSLKWEGWLSTLSCDSRPEGGMEGVFKTWGSVDKSLKCTLGSSWSLKFPIHLMHRFFFLPHPNFWFKIWCTKIKH